jgi:hypothetical protein
MISTGDYGPGPAMPHRDMTRWAKEMMLDVIDTFMREGGSMEDYDERAALKKQRDRIARFLRIPVKGYDK